MDQDISPEMIEQLREALRDYYGTAMARFPMAVMELAEIDRMSDGEVLEAARKIGL